MALFPCTFTGHRYAGPQQSAYLSCAEGLSISTVKARLCPVHFRQVLEITREWFDKVDELEAKAPRCRTCGGEADMLASMRLFPLKADELQYIADFCEEHLLELHVALEATRWVPMPD